MTTDVRTNTLNGIIASLNDEIIFALRTKDAIRRKDTQARLRIAKMCLAGLPLRDAKLILAS